MTTVAEASKNRRKSLQEQGLCIDCAKMQTNGKVRCESCAKLSRERNRKYNEAHPGKKYQRHKELLSKTEYRENHNKKRAEWRWRKRLLVIDKYGGKCECCGEDNPRFLQIDHINKDGKIHRAKVGRSVKLLRDLLTDSHGYKIRILCANCHFAITSYGGCPHEESEIQSNTAFPLESVANK